MNMNDLTIAFAYDIPPEINDTNPAGAARVEAEYEDRPTIEWMRKTLSAIGTVVDLPWSPLFIQELITSAPDMIFNITEGISGRNRESLVPAIAEAAGIPCTGSDATGLGISLDKGITKLIARETGIPTPDFRVFGSLEELERSLCLGESEETVSAEKGGWESQRQLRFPLLIKPNGGGSSLGIRAGSKVYAPGELIREAEWIFTECNDTVLAEEFIPGREFASALFSRDGSPEVLPAAEIRIDGGNPDSFYFYDMKSRHQKEVICPAEIPEKIQQRMDDWSLKLFERLGLKDLARVDYRLDHEGNLWLLEINPLPGLSPFYSVFPIQAKAGGISPEEIIHQLIYNNLRGTDERKRLEMAGKTNDPDRPGP
jgi:D-alanine--D-alanine ligase